MNTLQTGKLTTNQRFFHDLLLFRSFASGTVKIKTLAQIMAALEEQFVSHPNGFPKHFGADV
jgi:hypothetical protein